MINIIDFETYKKNEFVIPYCLCALYKKKTYVFYSKNDNSDGIFLEFLNFIVNISDEEKIEFYIHNLDFDGFIIISSLTKFFIKFKIFSEKRKIFMISIKYCGKNIYFKCSYKIVPLSLKYLGSVEGFEKIFFPYRFVNQENINYVGKIPDESFWENDDYLNFTKNKQKNYIYDLKNETIKYCINDILLTNKILENIFKIIDEEDVVIRKKCLSAPSMSYNIFFKKYNNFKIENRIYIEKDSYIRNSYFGGRCEVFGNLKKNEHIRYFDFSGMYGQCMLESFHSGESKFEKTNSIEKPGFYNIDYYSDFNNIPILPTHINKKLMFVNGKQNGTFWYEEIILFKEMNGKVEKINNAIIYEKYEEVFKNFTEKFTKIRSKGGYYKIFGKLMINSLYGSMGLKKKDIYQYITFSEEEFYNILKNTNVSDFFKINNCYIILILDDFKCSHFFKKKKEYEEKSLRNVSYASSISSKARIKLYKKILEIEKDGGRILYCDTDSVFAAYENTNKKREEKNIKWLDFYQDGVFAAPKTYGVRNYNEEIIKIKGIDNKEINLNEMKEKFYNEGRINFKDQVNFKKYNYILKQCYIEKEIWLKNYDKRIFSSDKKTTKPIFLNKIDTS